MIRFRLSRWWRLQRFAWRALFQAPVALALPEPRQPAHPSQLCRCGDEVDIRLRGGHLSGCTWARVMCRGCQDGDGLCPRCQGEGIDPAMARDAEEALEAAPPMQVPPALCGTFRRDR